MQGGIHSIAEGLLNSEEVVWLIYFVTLNQLERSVSRAPIEMG